MSARHGNCLMFHMKVESTNMLDDIKSDNVMFKVFLT